MKVGVCNSNWYIPSIYYLAIGLTRIILHLLWWRTGPIQFQLQGTQWLLQQALLWNNVNDVYFDKMDLWILCSGWSYYWTRQIFPFHLRLYVCAFSCRYLWLPHKYRPTYKKSISLKLTPSKQWCLDHKVLYVRCEYPNQLKVDLECLDGRPE